MPRPTTRGGFTAPLNELRRIGADLMMASRYAELAPYREELEAMARRIYEILDTELAVSQVNPQIGLSEEASAMAGLPSVPPVASGPGLDLAALLGGGS